MEIASYLIAQRRPVRLVPNKCLTVQETLEFKKPWRLMKKIESRGNPGYAGF